MIVHTIEPYAYKHPAPVPWAKPTEPQSSLFQPSTHYKDEPYEYRVALGGGWVISKINRTTAKVVYAKWLSSLGFKRGDYVIHRHTKDSSMPLTHYNYLRVVQLQEVHMLLEFTEGGKAKAVELIGPGGTRFWTTVHDWVRVEPPADFSWHFDVPNP